MGWIKLAKDQMEFLVSVNREKNFPVLSYQKSIGQIFKY